MAPSSLPWKTAAKQWRRERDEALALIAAWRPVVRAALGVYEYDWHMGTPPDDDMLATIAELESAIEALTPAASPPGQRSTPDDDWQDRAMANFSEGLRHWRKHDSER